MYPRGDWRVVADSTKAQRERTAAAACRRIVQRMMLRRLVVSAVLLVASIAAPVPAHAQYWIACNGEWGPGPCVWDARHNGDGQGSSWKMYPNGSRVYLTHLEAHTLLYGSSMP